MTAIAIATPMPRLTAQLRRRTVAVTLWISVTTAGAVLASLLALQLRSLDPRPVSSQQLVAFIIAVTTALIVSSGQRLVLRHYKLDVSWWIPASVVANAVAAMLIVPIAIGIAFAVGVVRPITSGGTFALGMVSLATSGLVQGTAQAFVLRRAKGTIGWAWIPATVVGGILAAAATDRLSYPLIDALVPFSLPIVIGLLTAVGAFLIAACQVPVLLRLLR